MPGPGRALGIEMTPPPPPLVSLSPPFSRLLKSGTFFLRPDSFTAGSRVAGSFRLGYTVLKLPYLVNLYPGFVVRLSVGVKLYLALKMVGGGEPAASTASLPSEENTGFPRRGPRLQILLQPVFGLALLALTSIVAVTPGEPGQRL